MEQWIKWEPINGLSENYDIIKISQTMRQLNIVLSDKFNIRKKIKIIFHHSVPAYRVTYETFRHKTIVYLDEKYDKDFYVKWTFFKVINSLYLQWLSEESCNIIQAMSFMHFCILTSESAIDIIADYEPKIELIGQ